MSRPHVPPLRSTLASALLLLALAGCGGGEPTSLTLSTSGSAGMSPGQRGYSTVAAGWDDAARRLEAAPPGAGHRTSPAVLALVLLNSRDSGPGALDCSYAVRVQNGAQAQTNLTAELLSSGSAASVIRGRVLIGDLAPFEVSRSNDPLVLRDNGPCALKLERTRFALAGSAAAAAAPRAPEAVSGQRGVLLEGVGGLNAIAALRDYSASTDTSNAGARPRFEAILSASAMVGQVNAALTTCGARIVAMNTGNNRVVLELDAAAGAQPPAAVAQRLVYSRAFEPYQPPPPQVDDHVQPATPSTDAAPP